MPVGRSRYIAQLRQPIRTRFVVGSVNCWCSNPNSKSGVQRLVAVFSDHLVSLNWAFHCLASHGFRDTWVMASSSSSARMPY